MINNRVQESLERGKYPKGISFGQTLTQLFQGKKCTRRLWSERTVKTFIKYYEEGVKVPAYNKDIRYGGEIIGWLTLTKKPYQDELINLTQTDLKAEGFPDYTFDQFINEFFDGKNQTVWVIWFEFSPNQTAVGGRSVAPTMPNQPREEENSVTVEEDTGGKEVRPRELSVVVNSDENQALAEDELTDEEERDRLHLERKVERAFYEAGKALTEIRDRRLYRSTHETFEQYCAERFAFKRRHPYQLMNAAQVVDNLLNPNFSDLCANRAQNYDEEMGTNRAQNDAHQMCANRAQILPASEWQVRPLTKLEPKQQVEVWTQAVDLAGGKVPPARLVKDVVQQIRERTKVENPWRVGEVATIIVKETPDLRGLGGCWAIVTEVHDFSCTVKLWCGSYQVKPENLKELLYDHEQQQEVKKLADRLSKIMIDEVEKPAKDFLRGLGKIDRPWLTKLEERLLKLLEEN